MPKKYKRTVGEIRRCPVCRFAFAGDRCPNMVAHPKPKARPGLEEQPLAGFGASAVTWRPGAKMRLADRVQQFLDAHDAAGECAHGALPHDRAKPKGCRCWAGESAVGRPGLLVPENLGERAA